VGSSRTSCASSGRCQSIVYIEYRYTFVAAARGIAEAFTVTTLRTKEPWIAAANCTSQASAPAGRCQPV
jgi:hypothetical protein